MKEKVTAVVLAAGQGRRMESKIQKQYMEVNGKPLIFYKKFAASSGNIKKLRKSVGMGNAGPVLFVSGG